MGTMVVQLHGEALFVIFLTCNIECMTAFSNDMVWVIWVHGIWFSTPPIKSVSRGQTYMQHPCIETKHVKKVVNSPDLCLEVRVP